MKPGAEKAVRRLHEITGAKCATCKPTPHGCCDPAFCAGVAAGLEATGRAVPPRGLHPTLRFMGPNGCVVPPELRPGCSGFVCEERLADRVFRREKERLERRAFSDPDVKTLLDVAARVSCDHILGGNA